MGLDSLVSPVTDVISRRMDDTVVILHARSGLYYTLDDVGALIWTLCDGNHRVAEMVTAICDEYETSTATVELDVLDLLGDLEREGLITTYR
jgi:hypothetical protein